MKAWFLTLFLLTGISARLFGTGSPTGGTELGTTISSHAKARQSLEAYGVKSWFIVFRGQTLSKLTPLGRDALLAGYANQRPTRRQYRRSRNW